MVANAAQSALGAPLSLAQQSGFFQWFCLTAVGSMEHPGRQCFRPSGPRFHDRVELSVTLDGDDRVAAADLTIARSFISNPKVRPFARDIAKSFLYWILPHEAVLSLQPEIDSIATFGDGESRVIAHRDVARKWSLSRLLRRSGGEAQVFMGKGKSALRETGGVRLTFENTDQDQLLVIRAIQCRPRT